MNFMENVGGLPLAFGMGNPTEIAIIAGVVILLFGGAKIAELGRSAGQGIKEFKKATRDEEPDPPAATANVGPASASVKETEHHAA